jgi:hypothetical protein
MWLFIFEQNLSKILNSLSVPLAAGRCAKESDFLQQNTWHEHTTGANQAILVLYYVTIC